MIGFNGTYLGAASLGNMRITAAAIGGQWVLGNWLLTATAQAIIAAFGVEEGTAVIRKTNDYLNAIAATDPQRAQQLAMFINEDPMLVCSLVETSKERYVIVPRGAYIKSNVNMKWGVGVEGKVETDDADGELWGTGNHKPTYMTAWCISGNNWRYMGSPIYGPSWSPTKSPVVIIQDSTGLYFNGKKVNGSYSNTIGGIGDEIWLCGHDSFMKGKVYYWKLYDFDRQLRNFVPCNHNNKAGLLDILNCVWYKNSGTGQFTISLTDK